MNESSSFSIATIMCVHDADKPNDLDLAIESIFEQEYLFHDLYLLVNGSLSDDAYNVVKKYNEHKNFFLIKSEKNIGLAAAMNYLIDNYVLNNDYDFVARMDADDICSKNRFSTQIEYFLDNKDVSVIGSDCIEIDENGKEVGYKKMEVNHDLMLGDIIKRCPFNHPTVMFRTEVFKCGNRYNPNLKNTQDYYLWVDLLSRGYKFGNINLPLLHFRITDAFYKKRGRAKAINDFHGRLYAMKKLDILSLRNIFLSLSLFLLRMSPVFVSKLAYKYLRRK